MSRYRFSVGQSQHTNRGASIFTVFFIKSSENVSWLLHLAIHSHAVKSNVIDFQGNAKWRDPDLLDSLFSGHNLLVATKVSHFRWHQFSAKNDATISWHSLSEFLFRFARRNKRIEMDSLTTKGRSSSHHQTIITTVTTPTNIERSVSVLGTACAIETTVNME